MYNELSYHFEHCLDFNIALNHVTNVRLHSGNYSNYIDKLHMFHKMKCFTMQFTPLIKLPGVLSNKRLLEITIRDSSLTYILDEISQLEELKVVYLRINNLKQLPFELFKLSNLSRLFLNKNSLSTLPQYVWCTYELEKLSFDENQIDQLPNEFYHFKKNVFIIFLK